MSESHITFKINEFLNVKCLSNVFLRPGATTAPLTKTGSPRPCSLHCEQRGLFDDFRNIWPCQMTCREGGTISLVSPASMPSHLADGPRIFQGGLGLTDSFFLYWLKVYREVAGVTAPTPPHTLRFQKAENVRQVPVLRRTPDQYWEWDIHKWDMLWGLCEIEYGLGDVERE